MKLTRRPRRESPETIIALIDVVFFLLVFFMVVGRMDATAPFAVDPAHAVTGADLPGGGATIAISQAGDLGLDGVALDRAGLLAGITKALASTPTMLIRVNAHKFTPLRDVLPLVAEIEALGGRDVVLVVTPALP